MTLSNEELSSLRHDAYSTSTPAEVRTFLVRLGSREDADDLPIDVSSELRFFAYATLRRVSSVSPKEAYDLLRSSLLPWCLKTYKRNTKADIQVHRSRELLGEWLGELSSDDFGSVLPGVLDYLTSHLGGRTFKTACWALQNVGFRRPSLLDTLRTIVGNHGGKAGDQALAVLLDLGLPSTERGQYVEEGIRRFGARQNNATYYLLHKLASPGVLRCLAAAADGPEAVDASTSLRLLGVTARVAEELQNDEVAMDQALAIVRRLYSRDEEGVAGRLTLAGNLLPAINATRVGEVFADLFLALRPSPAERMHALYVETLRMRESVRPRQLAGMAACMTEPLIGVLQEMALAEVENTGPTGSLAYDAKKGAIWAAMAFGAERSLAWLPSLLENEPNGYIQHEFMEMYACFRLDHLPERIQSWVTETLDAERSRESETWISRKSAMRVARSAASQEAFGLLLSPGFTLGGVVLLDTAESLADVALALTNEEEARAGIARELFDALHPPDPGPRYCATVNAILALALAGRIPHQYDDALVAAAFHTPQAAHDQSRLLRALVACGVPIPQKNLEQLTRWAEERDDHVGEAALEALIRIRTIEMTDAVVARLGLTHATGAFRWSPDSPGLSRWAPFYVGLLFEQSPEEFAGTIIDILQIGDWKQCSQIHGVLQRIAAQTSTGLPAEIRYALIDRLVDRITPQQAELGLFSVAAKALPEEFLTHDWDPLLDRWFVDARIAFAEAVRASEGAGGISPQARERGIKYLIRLAGDSQYGVRRSAIRALSETATATLCGLVFTWLSSDPHEPRVWAAEAAGWVGVAYEPESKWSAALVELRLDRHKKVRSAFSAAMEAKRRRQWAADYLAIIDQLIDPSNAEMLGAWRYGWALSRLANDDLIRELERIEADRDRAPNARHFAGLLLKPARKHWDEYRKEWPDPIYPLRGTRVATGSGAICTDVKEWDVEYILWTEPAGTPSSYGQWGGSCRLKQGSFGSAVTDPGPWKIRTKTGQIGEILVEMWSGLNEATFCGNGEYPSRGGDE